MLNNSLPHGLLSRILYDSAGLSNMQYTKQFAYAYCQSEQGAHEPGHKGATPLG